MYFGGLEDASMSLLDGFDLLDLSEEFGVKAIDEEALEEQFFFPRLHPESCLLVLQHPSFPKRPRLVHLIITYIGRNFLAMLPLMEEALLGSLRNDLPQILEVALQRVSDFDDSEKIVRFCLRQCQVDSTCDLLRETKTWKWGYAAPAMMYGLEGETDKNAVWSVPNIKAAMEDTPGRVVEGIFFKWSIRLDYGAEGKLRIVYESARPAANSDLLVNRFPAAIFAWKVMYHGEDVFNDKPVFICFPENACLHWSTTLPISAADLQADDELQIMVHMAENPLLSLVLYNLSANLHSIVFSEDILNRLPHIEYRCLSSYQLMKNAMANGGPNPPQAKQV